MHSEKRASSSPQSGPAPARRAANGDVLGGTVEYVKGRISEEVGYEVAFTLEDPLDFTTDPARLCRITRLFPLLFGQGRGFLGKLPIVGFY